MKKIIAALLFTALLQSPLSAGAIKNQLPDTDTMRSSLSANRSLLKRFEAEYQALSKQHAQKPTKDSQKKLNNLKLKIDLLRNENNRFLSMISKTGQKVEEKIRDPKDLTGKNWVAMDQRDKEFYLFSAMGALVKRDVLTMKPSRFYIEKMDQCIARHAEFENRKLDDLLVLNIYKFEPDTQEPISKFRKIDARDLRLLTP